MQNVHWMCLQNFYYYVDQESKMSTTIAQIYHITLFKKYLYMKLLDHLATSLIEMFLGLFYQMPLFGLFEPCNEYLNSAKSILYQLTDLIANRYLLCFYLNF